jgi:hypothetical protein
MFAGSRHHPYIRNVQRGRNPVRVPQCRTHMSPSPMVNTGTHSRDPPPGWRMHGVSPGFEEPTGSPSPRKLNAFSRPGLEHVPITSRTPTRGFSAFGAPRIENTTPSSPTTHGFNLFAGPKFGQPSPSPSPLHDRVPEFGPRVERRTSPLKFNFSPAKPFAAYSPNRTPRPAEAPAPGPPPTFTTAAFDEQAGPRGDQPGGVKRSKWRRVFAFGRAERKKTRIWEDLEVREQLIGSQRRSKTWRRVAEIEKLVKAGVGSKKELEQDKIFLKGMKSLVLDLAPNTYFDDYKKLTSDLSEDRELLARADTELRMKYEEEMEQERRRVKKEEEERRREAEKREEKRLKAQEMRRLFREAAARQREAHAKAERERLAREEEEQRQKEERERREREEHLRLQREEAERKEAERREAERREAERVRQKFTLYDAKWAALKSGDDSLALDFSQLPWPVLDITPTSSVDITYDRLQAFVFHPLRHSMEGKSRRERLKMDVLKWHPDKFEAKVLGKVVECQLQRAMVLEAAGIVARLLTQMLSEEVEGET